MATTHKIKSSVNGFEQTVTDKQLQALKANGWKGKIVSTTEATKSAKAPEEVKEPKATAKASTATAPAPKEATK